MTLANFERVMEKKAQKRGGVWENFGQKELGKLKEKYHYNEIASRSSECNNEFENDMVARIDIFNEWVKCFTL